MAKNESAKPTIEDSVEKIARAINEENEEMLKVGLIDLASAFMLNMQRMANALDSIAAALEKGK